MRVIQWLICIFLMVAAAPLLAEPGHVIRPSDLMDEPYRDAAPLAELKAGDPVEIIKRKGGWLKVKSAGRTGWVRMSKIRKGKAAAKPASGSEAKGVLDLASGRSGTGNVVSATGVRGLSEAELKEAKFSASEVDKLESFTVSGQQAARFAQAEKLVAKELEFIPAAER